ncbi:MAG TPA: hypothetical protein VFY29_13270 [Terriglobia bacterium]|nr:hypothetical protein [Terriglobia bacterium]
MFTRLTLAAGMALLLASHTMAQSGDFDASQSVSIVGKIARLDKTSMVVDTKATDGTVKQFTFELGTKFLAQKKFFKIGDDVSVSGHPSKLLPNAAIATDLTVNGKAMPGIIWTEPAH